MKNLLLIEPNVVLAGIYQQALQLFGYRVCHAIDAQTAIQIADGITPDLVILEPQIGRHGGIEFLHEFRSYTEWQVIPIVINSYMDIGSIKGVQQTLQQDLGVEVCLYKPRTTLNELVSTVNKLVTNP